MSNQVRPTNMKFQDLLKKHRFDQKKIQTPKKDNEKANPSSNIFLRDRPSFFS